MPLEDYLIPGEEVRFQSGRPLNFGGKPYTLIVTDKRLIMFARRGALVKKDDVLSFKLDEMHGVKYRESGKLMKTGMLEIEARSLLQLQGSPLTVKTLYQQLMIFL
ncbi:MAG: hypothetical protein JRN39_03510 [Nitrososphaerota archaeon]|nr:hypothetical protein [Nitrososphaerota archaeon]MDG6939451.1 hypothetical protein [Nitrososphaerota archaeon]